jgi:hypothetical protein
MHKRCAALCIFVQVLRKLHNAQSVWFISSVRDYLRLQNSAGFWRAAGPVVKARELLAWIDVTGDPGGSFLLRDGMKRVARILGVQADEGVRRGPGVRPTKPCR